MGSFNVSCFASQRTISYKNKAIIIPISQKATYKPIKLSLGDLQFSQYGVANTSCYPDAYWGYAGPIIEATYDDYGSFNLIDNEINKMNIVHFFNILHEKLFKVAQGENSCHDLSIDFQSLYNPDTLYSFDELTKIWHKMWIVGQKNRLFINEKNTPRQLQFSILHHKSFKAFDDYCKNITYNGNNIDEAFQEIIKKSNFSFIKVLPDSFEFHVESIMNLERLFFGNSFHYYNLYNNKKQLSQIIGDYCEKHPDDIEFNKTTFNKIKKLCSSALKHRIIHVGLEHFNIKLLPTSYAGQDYSNQIGKSFSEFIQSVNN